MAAVPVQVVIVAPGVTVGVVYVNVLTVPE